MTMDNWTRIKAIFQEALEFPPDERAAYLDKACDGEDNVRAEVETLLSAHDGGGELLQSPTATIAGAADGPGTQIGRYKLLQLIGEGGFGSVYMADQEEPVRRKVALKIIKLGMDTKQVIARFEAERQALALMDHPSIAQVFDAGATDSGRPYFVMELVRGIPITEYCDQNNLTTIERLELFQSVCGAVQHAHQKGIIHRDIKPSNVMVTLHDGEPVPKVIDFGIAKATNQRLTEKTLFTEYHQFVGTPQYMSPEQADMSGLDVDTRTDIYALGVLLYELLTGTTPFDAHRLRSMAYSEIHRVIREEDPDKPSTRLSTLGQAGMDTAKRRATDVAALRKALSGDLDWIVMMAIEKDRTRRYETANSLRLDVGRFLNTEPVFASPPSASYRVKKFLSRNRVSVAVVGAVALALLIGSGLATFGLLQARRERTLARQEAEAVRAINDFYNDMLGAVDPTQSRHLSVFALERGSLTPTRGSFDRQMSVVDMLKRAGERVEEAFEGKPLLEAEVRETLTMTLIGLGEVPAGVAHGNRVGEIRAELLPEDHPDRLRTEFGAAFASGSADRVREVRDAIERVYGPDHPKTLSATTFLAQIMTVDRSINPQMQKGPSRYSQAEELFRETLEKQREILGNEHRDVLHTMLEWASWYQWGGRGEESEPLAREAYETAQRILSPDDALTLKAANILGWALNFQGRYEEGEEYLREVLERQERVFGSPEDWTLAGLGRSLHRPEQLDEKEELWRRVHENKKATHNGWVISRDLAFFLVKRGKFDDGLQIIRESYEKTLGILGERNSWTTGAEQNLLQLLIAAGRHDDARERVVAQLDKLRRRAEGSDAAARDLDEYARQLLAAWPPELRQPRPAIRVAEKAVELAASDEAAAMWDTLASAHSMNGDEAAAIEAQRKAIELVRSEGAADASDEVADLVRYLARNGDAVEATEEIERQVRLLRDEVAEQGAVLAERLWDFGVSVGRKGIWNAAETVFLEAVTEYEGAFPSKPEDHVQALLDLGKAHLGVGNLGGAENRFGQAEELTVQTHGEGSAEHARLLRRCALRFSEHDRGEQTVAYARRAAKIYRGMEESKFRGLRDTEWLLAQGLVQTGESAEAARIARDMVDFWLEQRGEWNSRTGWARLVLAQARLRSGSVDSAESEARKALSILRRTARESGSPVSFAEAEAVLADCLIRRGGHDEAEDLLTRAFQRVDEFGENNPRARKGVLDRLVTLYETWGKPEQAARWRGLRSSEGLSTKL